MQIKSAAFVTSMAEPGAVHVPFLPEIAMVGRSNVGKSTLINSLTRNHKLAKTSSTPGKTRLVNYFRINDAFYLVDLPGYGYAQVSRAEQKRWSGMIEGYFEASQALRHVFLLLDVRHAPGEHDRAMAGWLRTSSIPFTVVATKCDKVPRSKLLKQLMDLAFGLQLDFASDIIPHATPTGQGRDLLLKRIGEVIGI